MAFDKVQYDNGFIKENYDRLNITIPKGRKSLLKRIAEGQGISVNQLVIDALENHCQIDLSKQDGE